MQDWLALPANFNPRARQFAAELRDQIVPGTDEGRFAHNARFVTAMSGSPAERRLLYTLTPPALGRHSVDEFLFDTRAGFCEHNASAFVFMMRALDVPARVVTGYQGGELNPVDDFMTLRQSDAHAWAEVWLRGQGWVRIDPTAVVAPLRIESGAAELARQSGRSASTDSADVPWLRALRFNFREGRPV